MAHIQQQYREYVDPKYVPDEFDISPQGASGLIKKPKVQTTLFGSTMAAAAAASSAPASTGIVRWNRNIHGPELLRILEDRYRGKYPRGYAARNEIAKLLNVKCESLRDNRKAVPNIVLE